MNQVTQQPANGAAATPADPPDPVVLSVLTHAGELWKLGAPPPQLQTPADPGLAAMVIKRLILLPNDNVKVYAYPVANSELDKAKSGIEFTLLALSIKVIATLARFDVLADMEEMAIDEALGGDEEEEDEDEERAELARLKAKYEGSAPAEAAPAPVPANGLVSPPS